MISLNNLKNSKLVEFMGQLSNQGMYRCFEKLHAHLSKPVLRDQVEGSPRSRQRQRRLRQSEVEEVVAAYQAGTTLKELAASHHVHRLTISAVLERSGIERRYRKLTNDDLDRVRNLYEQGTSMAAIAKQFEVNPSTIWHHLRRLGVTMRDVHGRTRDED